MTHTLDGARLKVVRAQAHLKAFNEEAGHYIDTQPYKISTKQEGNVISVEGVITAEPLPARACIIGDFVTNLRASLDTIAWELAMLAGKPLNDGQMKKITFPITIKRARFTDKKWTAKHLENVCGVPAATLSVIESVQPYHAGYQPLDTLDLLVNRDKHRMLLFCALSIESVGRVAVYQGDRLHSIGSGMNFATPAPPLPVKLDVKVDDKPTCLVALKDFPAPPTLT
jgi:hypothetical protein